MSSVEPGVSQPGTRNAQGGRGLTPPMLDPSDVLSESTNLEEILLAILGADFEPTETPRRGPIELQGSRQPERPNRGVGVSLNSAVPPVAEAPGATSAAPTGVSTTDGPASVIRSKRLA